MDFDGSCFIIILTNSMSLRFFFARIAVYNLPNVALFAQGVAPTKIDGFSLTSGDFPSLGTEKESSEKSARPQGII